MKLPSQPEATLSIGKIMWAVTAVFVVLILGVNWSAGQAFPALSVQAAQQDCLRQFAAPTADRT